MTGHGIRSDNRSQLTSSVYKKHIRKLGIKNKTYQGQTPQLGEHSESYFGRFKDDYICSKEFFCIERIRNRLELSVSDYDTNRPLFPLKFMMSKEVESTISMEYLKMKRLKEEDGRNKHVELLE